MENFEITYDSAPLEEHPPLRGKFAASESQLILRAAREFMEMKQVSVDEAWSLIDTHGQKLLNTPLRGMFVYINKYLPYRALGSIYEHFMRISNPTRVRGKWSSEDETKLIQMVAEHGRNWAIICKSLGRLNQDVKDKWKLLERKMRVSGSLMGSYSAPVSEPLILESHARAGMQHEHSPTVFPTMQTVHGEDGGLLELGETKHGRKWTEEERMLLRQLVPQYRYEVHHKLPGNEYIEEKVHWKVLASHFQLRSVRSIQCEWDFLQRGENPIYWVVTPEFNLPCETPKDFDISFFVLRLKEANVDSELAVNWSTLYRPFRATSLQSYFVRLCSVNSVEGDFRHKVETLIAKMCNITQEMIMEATTSERLWRARDPIRPVTSSWSESSRADRQASRPSRPVPQLADASASSSASVAPAPTLQLAPPTPNNNSVRSTATSLSSTAQNQGSAGALAPHMVSSQSSMSSQNVGSSSYHAQMAGPSHAASLHLPMHAAHPSHGAYGLSVHGESAFDESGLPVDDPEAIQYQIQINQFLSMQQRAGQVAQNAPGAHAANVLSSMRYDENVADNNILSFGARNANRRGRGRPGPYPPSDSHLDHHAMPPGHHQHDHHTMAQALQHDLHPMAHAHQHEPHSMAHGYQLDHHSMTHGHQHDHAMQFAPAPIVPVPHQYPGAQYPTHGPPMSHIHPPPHLPQGGAPHPQLYVSQHQPSRQQLPTQSSYPPPQNQHPVHRPYPELDHVGLDQNIAEAFEMLGAAEDHQDPRRNHSMFQEEIDFSNPPRNRRKRQLGSAGGQGKNPKRSRGQGVN